MRRGLTTTRTTAPRTEFPGLYCLCGSSGRMWKSTTLRLRFRKGSGRLRRDKRLSLDEGFSLMDDADDDAATPTLVVFGVLAAPDVEAPAAVAVAAELLTVEEATIDCGVNAAPMPRCEADGMGHQPAQAQARSSYGGGGINKAGERCASRG